MCPNSSYRYRDCRKRKLRLILLSLLSQKASIKERCALKNLHLPEVINNPSYHLGSTRGKGRAASGSARSVRTKLGEEWALSAVL